MNKYQIAYKRLSSRTYKYESTDEVYEDIEILGELVTREKPLKPIPLFIPMVFMPYRCPICRETVNSKKERFNYCPNCGQKIDWGV